MAQDALSSPSHPRSPAAAADRAVWHVRHRVPLLSTLALLPLYAVWWLVFAKGGGDLAAQQAWADFVAEHPGSPYNLSWYGGLHTANYSLISPYLMAALGVQTVTLLSGLASGWLGGMLWVRTGIARPLWPALLTSYALCCNVISGRTTFALGIAFALGACVLLIGARRIWWAGLCAALATMGSPVAGLYLVVVGAAFLLVRDWGRALSLLLPPFVVVGLTTLLFPFEGVQPMGWGRILAPVLFCAAVLLVAPAKWRTLKAGAAVYALGVVLTYLIASPIGTNVERFAQLIAPAVLLACLPAKPSGPQRRADRVKRVAYVLTLVFSVYWVTQKAVDDIVVYTKVPAWAQHTDSLVEALDGLGADRTRVEVVPARDHRESVLLAPHVNLAKGWNRQADVERGPLFYDGYPGAGVPDGAFSPEAYKDWLDRWAVGLVVLPKNARPDGPAEREAALVRGGPGFLEPVWQDEHWKVFRVRDAEPLVSGAAEVLRSDETSLVVRASAKGSMTVKVAYSPWLTTSGGCLARDGEFVRLEVDGPGEYRISSAYGWRPPERC
ncbi:glycosyltransferase family 87 protein [Streptomyces sp. N35]|uniref:glycosyltransferase family 87 protein n=1 Tax=Streptomyces sp. N35 TaxID=2795730 RepID=UPI001F31A3CB|nr:glycosyltransferase family 87 protein [Streptomyces sp. N35]